MRSQNTRNLEMRKYCVANECPMDEMACGIAAEFGHLPLSALRLGGWKGSAPHTRIPC